MEIGWKTSGRGRILAVLAAIAIGSTGAGCGLMKPAQSSGEATVSREVMATSRIDRETLAKNGLEELWYVPPVDPARDPRDIGVQAVYLLPEGLFTVSAPKVAGSAQLLKCARRDDGTPLWWEAIDGPIAEEPFAYHYPGDGQTAELFYRIADTVYCLDLRYGSVIWRQTVDPPIASQVIANDTHFFFGSDDGRFYGFRKNQRFHHWQHVTDGSVRAAPLLSGDHVVFGSFDGKVYSVTQEQGWVPFQSWRTPTGARVSADLASYSRWIFAGSEDYKLYCIESNDGSIYWSFVAGAPIRDKPLVFSYRPNEEYVFCTATRGSLDKPERTLFAIRLPRGDLAPAGDAVWRRENVVKVAAIGREAIYVVDEQVRTGEKTISALDVKTGEEKFRLPVNGFHFIPTNYADAGRNPAEVGVIYLVARDGSMQAIREKR